MKISKKSIAAAGIAAIVMVAFGTIVMANTYAEDDSLPASPRSEGGVDVSPDIDAELLQQIRTEHNRLQRLEPGDEGYAPPAVGPPTVIPPTGDIEAPPPDAQPPLAELPQWVNVDGSIDFDKVPKSVEVIDETGEPVSDKNGEPLRVPSEKVYGPPIPDSPFVKLEDGKTVWVAPDGSVILEENPPAN